MAATRKRKRRTRARANPGNPPRRRYSRRRVVARANPGNPPRRRHSTRRRRARRNPPNGGGMSLIGVKFPSIQTLAYGTAGFMGPPIIESYLTPYLPTQLTSSQWGRYVSKVGSVIGLSWATKALAGAEAGIKVAYGGAIYLAASVLNDFLPQITGGVTQPATAYYPRLANARSMRAQPMLGDYGRTASMTAQSPARLQPQGRY